MNLNKEFTNKIKNEPYKKSFPRDEEDKKQNETLKNVLLNILSLAKIRDKKEVFYVNHIAEEIIKSEGELDLKEPYLKFLINSVYDSVFMEDPQTKEEKGIYMAPLISQILEELGEKSSIIN